MADVPQIVKIGISLKMLPNNTAVHFKSDGARFGQTRTIKLLTGSKYKIDVVVRPGAVEATSMSVGGVTFPLEQQSKDPQSVVYTGQYDTEGVAHTKSGERQPVQISIQFTEAGMFETVWQVKYYNYNKRDHCQWGNSFNSIEYECKPNDTRTLMYLDEIVPQALQSEQVSSSAGFDGAAEISSKAHFNPYPFTMTLQCSSSASAPSKS